MAFVGGLFFIFLLWDPALVRSHLVPGRIISTLPLPTICNTLCPSAPVTAAPSVHEKECMDKKTQVANGYTVIEDSAYKLNMTAKIWNDARKACIEEGGHLADPDSTAKMDFLEKLYNSTKTSGAFIGLHDLYKENDWVSVLDVPRRWDLLPWGAYHVKERNLENQNCARIMQRYLDDYYCFRPLPFICEISLKHCDLGIFDDE